MRLILRALLCLTLALTGCTLGTNPSSPSPETGTQLAGRIHGGQQPVVGAHVYMFAANTTGYGGSGIAASTANASVSLLNAGSTGTADSLGAYVLTDSNGDFTITGDYTCTPGQQVYLYALGGNPGAGINSAAGFLAAIGNCPASGSFAGAIPFIFMNEVSTIATAYALAGFASDATHVSSSSTPLAKTGIANAFRNTTNLETLATGAALSTTPTGNGTVPQRETDTLANILAACINSTGPGSPSCSTLFTNAPNGTTLPTDTATAAINIAQHPASNIANLYALQTPAAPYQPVLTSAPNDFTLVLYFSDSSVLGGLAVDGAGNIWVGDRSHSTIKKFSSTGAEISPGDGFSGGGFSISNAPAIAIDDSGNVWAMDYTSTVTEFSNSGTVLSGTSGYTLPGTIEPQAISIDGAGDAWIINGKGLITELSSTGATLLGGSTGYGTGIVSPLSLAIDSRGDAWVTNINNTVTEISPTGGLLSGTGYSVNNNTVYPTDIAIDASGNAWITNLGNSVTKLCGTGATLCSTGAPLSPYGGYTGGGLVNPRFIAIDGAGNAWATNTDSGLTQLSNSGAALSPSTGYTGSTSATSVSVTGIGSSAYVAIDGSGDVWAEGAGVILYEFIGAATPVVTPLATGVKTNTLGTRP